MQEVLYLWNEYPLIAQICLFVFGAVVGSFLNVCIYRLPDEEKSVVRPASYCPACKKPIVWYDNIPLLSYILLRGQCRQCQAKISIRYFLVEFITGMVFVSAVMWLGLTIHAAVFVYVFCSLFVSSLIDFQYKIIPDEITCYGMLVGLIASYFFPVMHGEVDARLAIADSILGLLCGGGIIYLLAIVGGIIFRKEAMGGGDIKLVAMIGAFLGVKLTIIAFLLSPYFAILIAIYYKFYKKEETIPYGPFLALGTMTAMIFGDSILQYLGM